MSILPQYSLTEGSLFAGIMGFGEGFRRAGFKNLWAVEKEPFCQKVIRARFSETEIFDDVKDCGKHNLRAVDVLTAGFPCQDLSVAGKRAGLEGARSGLFWEVVRIVGELRPTWFVLENVPGLFSSCEGRDFAIVLNALDELGYGLAWRVLNSQFFGVAQRRRRVFIIGRFGEPCPAGVLFEPEGSSGDIAPSGEAWGRIANTITDGSGRVGSRGCDDGANLAVSYHENLSGNVAESDIARAQRSGASHSYQFVAAPITASYGKQLDNSDRNNGRTDDECAPAYSHRVRDFAGLPKGLDSARYRALGNAVTVSVAEWIARRILAYEEKTK